MALLVLVFGLLGVAAMQLKALQSAHVSYQRSIAAVAAQDAQERLWVELGEHSRVCPFKDPDALAGGIGLDHVNDWGDAWSPHFNQLEVQSSLDVSSDSECGFRIFIGWQDERFVGEDVSNLEFLAKLPGL
ncbi:type IV pilus modification protein PilV [Halomonas aestuarii]|uniref:type IV pilus modification protein PilV n=1 Tax=Halomonas aestuarii TaxID=1897729 RepID=UPI001FCC9B78|nr:type IV pilus modification protein PilV [Halomonas aestuarii]